MTLSEEECSQKWSSISETLENINVLIKDLTNTHQKSADFENVEISKLHQAAAYTMTELEKFKLRFSLTPEALKDHSIQIEQDRIEKYQKKIKKSEKPETDRPFRIDSNASKRTVAHFTNSK